MLHFSTFEKSFNDKLEIVKSRKQELFYNEIFTFDIETTSCYFINGKLHEFDFSNVTRMLVVWPTGIIESLFTSIEVVGKKPYCVKSWSSLFKQLVVAKLINPTKAKMLIPFINFIVIVL